MSTSVSVVTIGTTGDSIANCDWSEVVVLLGPLIVIDSVDRSAWVVGSLPCDVYYAIGSSAVVVEVCGADSFDSISVET